MGRLATKGKEARVTHVACLKRYLKETAKKGKYLKQMIKKHVVAVWPQESCSILKKLCEAVSPLVCRNWGLPKTITINR